MEGKSVGVGPGRPVWALGLMSGTSMDGVDAATVLTDGETVAEFGPDVEITPAYSAGQKGWIDHAGAEAAAEITRGEAHDPALRRLAEGAIEDIHFAAIAMARARGAVPAVVGFHGQTVFHAPAQGRTVQLGDGARLAGMAGVPVVWDFRSADMAAGGEGAPLAPFYHHALARRIGATRPVAFVNIGGVANVSWVDPGVDRPEADGALVGFDTGPGNALIDDWVQRRTGAALDRDGALAARGRVDRAHLHSNAIGAFLERRPPKSLDRNTFHAVLDRFRDLSDADGAATLTAFTVECIARSRDHLPAPPARWLICGGGRHNRTMMRLLAERLAAPVEPVEAAGLDGDMLEAQAFAYLAVRVLRGLPTSAPATTGCRAPVCGGRVGDP